MCLSLSERGGVQELKHVEKKLFRVVALAVLSVMISPLSSLRKGIPLTPLVKAFVVFQNNLGLEGVR